MQKTGLLTAALATLAVLGAAGAADISGAGATFPYPIYARWADAYRKETGIGLNYQSIGSGGGVKQVIAGTVTFGASDRPLSAAELEKHDLLQFPTVVGGVVPVVNLEGVSDGALTLDGPTLAKIFQGEIRKWNDPAITKLNPSVGMPPVDILIVHRADGSGTTFVWTDYLSKMSPAWKAKVGAAAAVAWPAGLGAKGNEGVANNVQQTSGAIGYVEYAYARQNRMTTVKLINREGTAATPSLASFAAAAANADWTGAPGFGVSLTDEPGAASWPVTSATFILVPRKPARPEETAGALKFFDWAYAKGGRMAEELDYVPLPETVVAMIRKSWSGVAVESRPAQDGRQGG